MPRLECGMTDIQLQELHEIMWPSQSVESVRYEEYTEDVARWFSQGIHFNEASQTSSNSFGLYQEYGGPCGVLAPLQAEIIRLALFECDEADREINLLSFSRVQQKIYLSRALASLLGSVTKPGSKLHLVTLARSFNRNNSVNKKYDIFEECSVAQMEVRILNETLPSFESKYGVVLFVFSILLSRGISQVRSDMDDPNTALTAQFGHCTQELLNLLLCGKAITNVFDGDKMLGETSSEILLKGVKSQPRIGYLSYLEVLRYCEVGSFYKHPKYPVFVIGSTSHFSVLFGCNTSVCECSEDQLILQNVRKAFLDHDLQECGYIKFEEVIPILQSLCITSTTLNGEPLFDCVQELLNTEGGIVLWEDFWNIVSVIVKTKELDQLLLSKRKMPINTGLPPSDSDNSQDFQAENIHGAPPRSDFGVARELQTQLEDENSVKSAKKNLSTIADDIVKNTEDIILFHYNGLKAFQRTPRLSKVIIKPQTQKCIGMPTPLRPIVKHAGHRSPIDEILKLQMARSHHSMG